MLLIGPGRRCHESCVRPHGAGSAAFVGLVADDAASHRNPRALHAALRAARGARGPCARAVRRARRAGGEVLVGLTVELDPAVDPSAVVFASRAPASPGSATSSPTATAPRSPPSGAAALEARARGASPTSPPRWRELAGGAHAATARRPAGRRARRRRRLRVRARRRRAPHWAGFAAGVAARPEVAVARRGDEVRLTRRRARRSRRRPRSSWPSGRGARSPAARARRCRCWTPIPPGASIAGVAPPEHYEAAVARAVERIRAGALEKIVLAREVAVHAPPPHDAAAVFGVLRAALPLLLRVLRRPRRRGVRRRLARAAGPPRGPARARRSRWPARRAARPTPPSTTTSASSCSRSDKDREEQAIVTRRIARALRPHTVWVAAPEEPAVVKVANIQHLATPIRAQLREPVSAVELAGLLHPTPAVGGEPSPPRRR